MMSSAEEMNDNELGGSIYSIRISSVQCADVCFNEDACERLDQSNNPATSSISGHSLEQQALNKQQGSEQSFFKTGNENRRQQQFEHSVNVTLEVTANLRQPNRVVWYKNNRQLTSSERPVLYSVKRKQPISELSSSSKRSTSVREKRGSIIVEEEKTVEVNERVVRSSEQHEGESSDKENEERVLKYAQESSERGSKLTIYDIQDQDYGQYTCKLIDLDGQQYDIHAQLRETTSSKQEEEEEADTNNRSKNKTNFTDRRIKHYTLSKAMDEVIEVKEGDLNIELGIQILPETNDDEELMSEEEKNEFIESTKITWFKDDVKLDQQDPSVKKLFQFTYDQAAGFHRLVVKRATKETEGVYTCLVENESGTSSCSTQLVVGPGNKPRLTSRLQDVTVYVGQTLEFRIKSSGLPPIDSCQWFKDDELLIELATSSSSTTTTKSKTNERVSMTREEEQAVSGKEEDKLIIFKLCIDNLKLDDTGRYKCRINNEFGYDETDCFVKVLQEIIEEHEEIEETIEETMRLGGGKKSTREEEEEVVEEEEETTRTHEEDEERQRSIKRQRQEKLDEDVEMGDDDEAAGWAPRFRRKLEDFSEETTTTTTTTTTTRELIVSTERDQWSNSRDSLKVKWFVDDVEVTSSMRRDYEVENFYDETKEVFCHKLVIKNRSSTIKNDQKFSCKASNKFGESETSCKATKRESGTGRKPTFLRTLEDLETYVDETIVLKVAVDSQDELDDLRFVKDGKLIYSSATDGNSKEFKTNRSRTKIRTYEETIEVEVEEEEETRYTRRRYSRGSSRTQKRARVFELEVENVEVDQQGNWECEARNRFGSSSCKADVEVFAEPKIVTDLKDNERLEPGREIRLTVEASGSPTPVYSWFKDGLGIAEEEDRVFTQTKSTTTTTTTTTRRRSSVVSMRTNEDGVSISGETLIIKDARPDDAGVYSCKVENRLGQVKSRDCKLTVVGHGDDLKGAPRIIKDFSRDQVFELDEGESIVLKVLAEGNPRPRQHWFKDTEEIVERVSRFEVENEGQEYKLKIKRSEQNDSGKYKVVLKNEFGETESRTVVVKVNKVTEETESQRRPSAPHIMADGQDKVVGLDSNVSFDVQVGGHPKPFVTWYKNGRRLTESPDGRVSFVEEETITTITEEEEDLSTGEKHQKVRKESSTVHKLVIRNVRESDEAIYSLKAENEHGSTKSSLVSLTVDRRKEATDEVSESKKREEQRSSNTMVEEEEETTTTTETVKTTTVEEEEDEERRQKSSKQRSSTRRSSGATTVEGDEEDEESSAGGKRRTTTRTTRTTTTTTTTTEEEREREEAERREREQEDEEKRKRSQKKRRVVEEEVEEDVEKEEASEEVERVRRRTVLEEEKERKVEDEEVSVRKRESISTTTDAMEVDEERKDELEEETRTSRSKRSSISSDKGKKSSIKEKRVARRESGALLEETTEKKEEVVKSTTVERRAPRVVSAPKKVTAGVGSSPVLEVEVETNETTDEEEKITWLKDDQPIPARLLRDDHIEIDKKPTSEPGVTKHVLRINSLRPSDAASYKLKVETPEGTAETAPIVVEVDRTMRPGEKPVLVPDEIKPVDSGKPSELGKKGVPEEVDDSPSVGVTKRPERTPSTTKGYAPEVISATEEVVAGAGSSPELVAVIKASPQPQVEWFKDGQPIKPSTDKKFQPKIEKVDEDTDKFILKIADLKPMDVGAYHVRAVNDFGEAESELSNVRIDRSMSATDAPKKTEKKSEPVVSSPADELAPQVVSAPKQVTAGVGSSPELAVRVKTNPDSDEQPEITWLKDDEPIPARLLRDDHVEISQEPTSEPGVTKHTLKINSVRPTDEAPYKLKVETPEGKAETAPIELKVDRTMRPGEEPVVVPDEITTSDKLGPSEVDVPKETQTGAGRRPADEDVPETGAARPRQSVSSTGFAPQVLKVTEEVVAGAGSSPELVAVIKASPQPQVEWFKDGQPIKPSTDKKFQPKIEKVDEDTDKFILKIADLKPMDVGAYHVRAVNDFGEAESELSNVRIDRSMSATDTPKKTEKKSEPVVSGPADELAPQVVSAPKQVTAGVGSSPELEVKVQTNPNSAEEPKVTWLKDDEPIPARLLRDDHVEISQEPTSEPGVTKHTLKINSVRPTDEAPYKLKVETPEGKAETAPIELKVDRTMRPGEEPVVVPDEITTSDKLGPSEVDVPKETQTGAGRRPADEGVPETGAARPRQSVSSTGFAPQVLKVTEEVVAGAGSSPELVVVIKASPQPEVEWFKDGQPIDVGTGKKFQPKIEKVDADTDKFILKIADLKPMDVGAYHVRAVNDFGEAESELSNVRIDRKLSSSDVLQKPAKDEVLGVTSKDKPKPQIVSAPKQVTAGVGSSPELEVKVKTNPNSAEEPKVTWLKDDEPIPARLLRDDHVEISQEPTSEPGVTKHTLKINSVRPTDEAPYKLKVETPEGKAETAPIELKVDRTMRPGEEPVVVPDEITTSDKLGPSEVDVPKETQTGVGRRPADEDVPETGAAKPRQSVSSTGFAPQVVKVTEEVVAGVGSSPELVAVIKASPQPEVEWFKDGQPIDVGTGKKFKPTVEKLDDDTSKCSLKIADLKPIDVGAYHVRAVNDFGEDESAPSNVRIDRKMSAIDVPQTSELETPFDEDLADADSKRQPCRPQIKKAPRVIHAREGDSPVLEVEVSGEPVPEVQWFKDGERIDRADAHFDFEESPEDGVFRLRVHDVSKPVDEGAYTLQAANEAGTVNSEPIQLQIEAVPGAVSTKQPKQGAAPTTTSGFAPQVTSVTEEIVAGVGSSPEIVAVIKGSPQPEVEWFKDGQPIKLSDNKKLKPTEKKIDDDTSKFVLEIAGLKPADVGAYHVRAVNDFGETESVPTNVRIDRKMSARDLPQTSEIKRPFDEDSAKDDSKRKLRAPKIKRAPGVVHAREGESPVLEVEVSGEPVPEVHWFRNGVRIERTDAHFVFEDSPEEGVYRLRVRDVRKSVDEGDYTLQATNEAGTVKSEPIQLQIEAAPKVGVAKQPESPTTASGFAPQVVSVTEEVVAGVGSSPELVAVIKASPHAKVEWFKDGQPIKLGDSKKLKLTEEKIDDETSRFVLKIVDLKPSDVGAYHVRATNDFGETESVPSNVRLDRKMSAKDAPKTSELETPFDKDSAKGDTKKKLRAPKIKRAPAVVHAREGESPVLEVEVSGEPIPEVRWFRNGVRIERTDAHFVFEDSPEKGVFRLRVCEVRKSVDEGNYTVEATNEAGTVQSEPIKLQIEAAPVGSTKQPHGAAPATTTGFAPQVISVTEEVVAGAGSSPELVAVIKASPQAQVEWFKDGQPIKLSNNKKFELTEEKVDDETSKFVLKIIDLKPVDVGAYHVRAVNEFGEVESEPSNVRIDRSLSATDAPQTNEIETPFDEDLAKPDAKRKLRAPVIKRMPRKVVAALGSNPVIEIEVSGVPKPEVVWFKNGKRVTELRTQHITCEEAPGGIYRLSFTNVKFTDQAEYTVIATNEAGTVESLPISLVVDKTIGKNSEPFVQEETNVPIEGESRVTADGTPIEPPKILRLGDKEAVPGQTVRLEAEVLGNPKPDIKWLKDGDELDELNIVNTTPDSNLHSLTLKNVNDLYDGVYALEASNVAGVARKEARVKVVDELSAPPEQVASAPAPSDVQPVKRKGPEESHDKPFIKKGLKFSQVNQGRSIKFEVQIDGKYDELIWTKDGEQINVPMEVDEDIDEAQSDTSTLKDDLDEELLTGDDLATGTPKRRFPPRILVRPRNAVAGPGSRISFEVRYCGEPKPEVIWYKNGQVIKVSSANEGKLAIEEETVESTTSTTTTTTTATSPNESISRFIIEDIEETDVGEYYCQVENAYGSERCEPVTLELDETMEASDDLANTRASDGPLKRGRAPRILAGPRSVKAPKGSKVAFEVQVSGEPRPIVNWFRDGRLITQTVDGHVTVEEFSTGCVRLVLNDIGPGDVGQYQVVAENKLGSARTIPVTLTLEESAPGGAPLAPKDLVEAALSDDDQHRPKVGRPPRILLRPKNVQTRPGASVTLEVSVVGGSPDADILWFKDGKQIKSSERVRIEKVTSTYQKLVITDVRATDAGEYTVSAANDFGRSVSTPVRVGVSESVVEETTTTTSTTTTTTSESFYERFVDDGSQDGVSPDGDDGKKKRAPRFTLKPRNKRAPLGSKVDFEVKVSGTPKPDVIWYKNGRRIHMGSDGRVRVEEFSDGGQRLVVEDLEETDAGVYAAEARNECGSVRTEDVQLRVTQRTELSERTSTSRAPSGARVTTRTKKTRTHYTFSEERHGYVTLTINDAQLEHDGDYQLVVRNKYGEARTRAPLVVIPRVEARSSWRPASSATTSTPEPSLDGRDSRSRRTPFDELEDYNHELDRSVGVFGSESRYQSGDDTYLLQLRDTEFPLRLRKYLRFGARQSPSLRSNLMDAHWGAGARVTIRERRKFREVMDEEIDDEKRGLDLRPTPMRLQKEVGTCGYAAAQLEHLRVEAAERVAQRQASAEPAREPAVDMMPPFFRVKLKDAVIEEAGSGRGQEAVFVCLAAGLPAPEYSWFRNDIIITQVDLEATVGGGPRIQIVNRPDGGSELRIRDPRFNDSACFKCVARNVHGNVTCRARLRVAARPSRPEPPEYVGVTAREVFLQWRPPRDYDVNAAEVLGYKLEISQSALGEEDQWRTLAADIGHEFYVVDDLAPATSYSFRLSARNKFGWSDSSYSSYVTTCRADAEAPSRLAVPHEMRARQYVADICDVHVLRHCEDPKAPELDYTLEQSPVQLNGSSGSERLTDAFTVGTEVCRGRFSLVAQARRKADGEPVVLKAVPLEAMQAAQTKSELDILRSLQHEKVVQLRAAYRDDQAFVFVMERLSGLDVLTYLSSFTSYNEDLVSKIITQVMDAIEYLHFRGMCLLELLPDNVVMTNGRSCSLKLVDFSSARFVPRSGARVPVNSTQSVEYCPPEVIAGHEVSTASDVWCIGVLTYLLLSGHSPFRGDSGDEETRENVRLGRYKYDHLYANCTPEVTRFLINVFKKHSSKRPTIEQLYENKWLLPNESMIRKRQQAIFRTDKITAFAEQFHKSKSTPSDEASEQNQLKLAQVLAIK